MAAFATVADLEAGWRDLSAAEESRASELLDRAGTILASLVEVDPEDAAQADVLRVVSCAMVQRAMSAGELGGAFGVSQQSITAVGFTESRSYSNPAGDMYLTKLERKMLGLAPGGGRMVPVAIHDGEGREVDW